MARCTRPRDDSGAALVISLVFITVIAVVLSALLSFADTSVRATIALRAQARQAYAADGAAQVAINALRRGTYTNDAGERCFGTSDGLLLPGFPTAASGSAFVACSTDAHSGSASSGPLNEDNTPPDALLTLGATTETGLGVGTTTAGTFAVDGGVVSNSGIDVSSRATLSSSTSISARSCTGSPPVSPATDCRSRATVDDPGYPAPTAAPEVRQVPKCPDRDAVVRFAPGLYTDARALTACRNDTLWFAPGTYYFDFDAEAPVWTIDSGSLLGGTPTQKLTGAGPEMPGACVSPLVAPYVPAAGVEFVFGGLSQLVVSGTAQVELCGSYQPSTPPIAVYGLTTALAGVSAQTGCLIDGSCSLLSSADSAAGSRMYVQGTVYAPAASVALSYGPAERGGPTGQFVADGLIARSVSAVLDRAAVHAVGVPALQPGPRGDRTDVLLDVYLCPEQDACSADEGELRLQVTLGISNPAEARTVTVSGWAVQR